MVHSRTGLNYSIKGVLPRGVKNYHSFLNAAMLLLEAAN